MLWRNTSENFTGEKTKETGKSFSPFSLQLDDLIHTIGSLQNFSSICNLSSRGHDLLEQEEKFSNVLFPTVYEKLQTFSTLLKGHAKCKIIISLTSFIMAWLQKPLFNPRDSNWAWIGKESGIYTRCQWVCAAMASTFWDQPPMDSRHLWLQLCHTNTHPHTRVRFRLALCWAASLCLCQWLPNALSTKPECSSWPLWGSSAKGLAGKLQLITETALATQGKTGICSKKCYHRPVPNHTKEQQDGSESSAHLKHTLRGKTLSFLTGLCFVQTQEIQTSPHEKG